MPTTRLRKRWLDREVDRAVAGKRGAGVRFVVERIAWSYLRQEPRLPWQAVGKDLQEVEDYMASKIMLAGVSTEPAGLR